MIRKAILTVFSCLTLLFIKGQERAAVTSFTSIPEILTKEADVVYRLDEGFLTVNSQSDYTLSVHQIITLLNEKANPHLYHRLHVDKFNKIEAVDILIYDREGKLVKKYGKKDFSVEAVFDGISLVDDNKMMKLYTPSPGYPCTVDVQYKTHSTSYVELPNWFVNYHRASVEKFRYQVSTPTHLDIRQRTLNLDITPQIETIGNRKLYKWEKSNISAKGLESEGFEASLYLPQVEIAPNEFSYDGYAGSFRTWKDFGLWNYQFYEEKKPFVEERIQEIKALVLHVEDKQEKIRILYDYLKNNFRYVSIQLGIGGFKPFPVRFVDQNKYGDCKALTNYMRCLLQVVNIPSFPALINAGNNKIPADPYFPADPFNHVILCIPGQKDTTWLECTSTTNKVGELGTFTENKKALLLTPDGGLLVNTPRSNASLNQIVSVNQVILHADGGATISSNFKSSGEAGSVYRYVSLLSKEEQLEMLVKQMHYKNADEVTLHASETKDKLLLSINRAYHQLFDFKSGNKVFYPLCINPLSTEDLKEGFRLSDFLFHYPYVKKDTTVFQLPAGNILELVPKDKDFHTPYSSYKRTCSYDREKNHLSIISSLVLDNHIIPAAFYLKMVNFFKEVKHLEQENFILSGVGPSHSQ
jgi:hypothetical protein